jgi:hypothetical protein
MMFEHEFWKQYEPIPNFTTLTMPDSSEVQHHEPSLRIIFCLQIMKLALPGELFNCAYQRGDIKFNMKKNEELVTASMNGGEKLSSLSQVDGNSLFAGKYSERSPQSTNKTS